MKYIGVILDEEMKFEVHANAIIKSLLKYFGIFNHLFQRNLPECCILHSSTYVYNLELKFMGPVPPNILAKLQTVQNKLLKLLRQHRQHPRTSTNAIHHEQRILKIDDLYRLSLSLLVYDCIHQNCPAIFKNYFIVKNTPHLTRQAGQLHIQRARTNMGSSRAQYHAAEIWNNLSRNVKSALRAQTSITLWPDIFL